MSRDWQIVLFVLASVLALVIEWYWEPIKTVLF